jgi:hypothetical protein
MAEQVPRAKEVEVENLAGHKAATGRNGSGGEVAEMLAVAARLITTGRGSNSGAICAGSGAQP